MSVVISSVRQNDRDELVSLQNEVVGYSGIREEPKALNNKFVRSD